MRYITPRMSAADRVRSLLARPGLPAGERTLIATKIAATTGRWEALAACIEAGRDSGLDRTELEEALLQTLLFAGFPRVVSAFEVLQTGWLPDDPPAGGGLPADLQLEAGHRLFDQIYDDKAAAVREMLASYHQELHDYVFDAAYGRILSRPALSGRLRELLAVAALHAMQGQLPQLVAHARGALRLGATEREVREAMLTADPDEAAADAVIARATRSHPQ